MRFEEQAREYTAQGTLVPTPLALGFGDCMALFLSAILLAVSILWPQRIRAGHESR